MPMLCSWFCLEYICAPWASTHTSTLFPWSAIQPLLLPAIPWPTHPGFVVTDLRERALVNGYWPADTVAEKAAEAGQVISKNKEVWAAARVTAKITAPRVEGGDPWCCHHSARCRWLLCLFFAIRMDSAPALLCITRAPSLKPRVDPLVLLSLAYVSCSSYRQGWASKELPFFFFNFSIVIGICFSPVIIRLPQTKKSRSDARESPNGICSSRSQIHSTNKSCICLCQVLLKALGMQKWIRWPPHTHKNACSPKDKKTSIGKALEKLMGAI